MQSGFGVFRREDTLQEGMKRLTDLRDPLERVSVDDSFFDGSFIGPFLSGPPPRRRASALTGQRR